MLFQNIAALVAKGIKLSIQIESADNGKLEVSVIPTSESGKSGVSLVAKSFVATPAELDAEFPAVIAGFAAVNSTLKDQLDAMEAQAAAIAKEAQEAQASKASAKTTTARVSPVKPSGPTKYKSPELGDFEDTEDDVSESTEDDAPSSSSAEKPSSTTTSVAEPMSFML